jgi:hypothetical protein
LGYVPAEHNDDDGVKGDGDKSENGNEETIERLDEGERTQPGGGVDNVAGVVRHTVGQVCGSIHEADGRHTPIIIHWFLYFIFHCKINKLFTKPILEGQQVLKRLVRPDCVHA